MHRKQTVVFPLLKWISFWKGYIVLTWFFEGVLGKRTWVTSCNPGAIFIYLFLLKTQLSGWLHLAKLPSRSLTASFPLKKKGHPQKKHVIFQPSMFRGELWVASLRVTGKQYKGNPLENFRGNLVDHLVAWKVFKMWADCLGFWSLKKCPQPQTRWVAIPQATTKTTKRFPRCLRWFQHYLQIRNRTFFWTEIPQKDGAGVRKKWCKQKGGEFCDGIPNCFLCVFFDSESGFWMVY